MASDQARRETTVTEREVKVEKDIVPKMASHFESMTGKESAAEGKHRQGGTQFESLSDKGNKMPVSNEGEQARMKRVEMPHSVGKFVMSSKEEAKGKETGEHHRPTLEDIHESRAKAQQMSMEAIRAAEERYNKAKESLSHGGEAESTTEREASVKTGQQGKESGARGAQAAKETAMEKGRQVQESATETARSAKEAAMEKGERAKENVIGSAQKAKGTAMEKGRQVQESAAEAARRAKETAVEKGERAKESVIESSQKAKDTAAEKAQKASEYVRERGAEAGDVAARKGQETKEQVATMAGKAKDTAVDVTKKATQYAGEKAAAAKEATVEGGKGAAHYAGVVADKAAAVGWTAAHFTTEKVVQGTKVVAGTVEKAVEYTGHKAVEVGAKAADITKEKAAAAADTVVGYTARKKEEAVHSAEKKDEMVEGGEEERKRVITQGKETVGEATRDVNEVEEGAGGVLGAIGETIVEIAQNTKNIVIGGDDDEADRIHSHEAHYEKHEHGRR